MDRRDGSTPSEVAESSTTTTDDLTRGPIDVMVIDPSIGRHGVGFRDRSMGEFASSRVGELVSWRPAEPEGSRRNLRGSLSTGVEFPGIDLLIDPEAIDGGLLDGFGADRASQPEGEAQPVHVAIIRKVDPVFDRFALRLCLPAD